MYLLKSNKLDYNINLPTTIDEVKEVIKNVLDDVKLAPHYSVIAIAFKTTLFKLAAQAGGNTQDNSIQVTPIIAKTADADTDVNSNSPLKEQIVVGNVPIIAPSVLERGFHLSLNIGASMAGVMNYLQNDPTLRINLFQKKYDGNVKALGVTTIDGGIPMNNIIAEDNNTPVYIIAFKIVANNDIVASTPVEYTVDDITTLNDIKANEAD